MRGGCSCDGAAAAAAGARRVRVRVQRRVRLRQRRVRLRLQQVVGAAASPASAGGERGPAKVGDDPTVGPTWQSRRGPAQSRPSEGEERFEFF